jgi:hypothetical protein
MKRTRPPLTTEKQRRTRNLFASSRAKVKKVAPLPRLGESKKDAPFALSKCKQGKA